MSRARRPPKRRCPGCGGDYYAWSEGGACRACLDAGPAPIVGAQGNAAGRFSRAPLDAGRRGGDDNSNRDDIPY